MHYIVGIDPGNVQSAFCICNEDLKPMWFGKMANELMWADMVDKLQLLLPTDSVEFAIEMIASYGLSVGKEVFDTCVWIGRMAERLRAYPVTYIYRKDEKMVICGAMRANDASIRQALVDRFAPGEQNYGKGTKHAPGFFYGFRADIWQSFAVAVTHHDLQEERNGKY